MPIITVSVIVLLYTLEWTIPDLGSTCLPCSVRNSLKFEIDDIIVGDINPISPVVAYLSVVVYEVVYELYVVAYPILLTPRFNDTLRRIYSFPHKSPMKLS